MSDRTETPTSLTCDIAAGAALGVLVGLLVGLTTSGIVGSIIGSLIALVTAFIGLGGPGPALFAAASAIRIVAFSAAAVIALLAGVTLRTHDVLAPDVKAMIATLTAAGFPAQEARDLVRFQRFGLVPSGATVAADNPVVRGSASSLFSAGLNECNNLRRDRALGVEERIAGLEGYGEPFGDVAARLRRLPEERRGEVLDAAEFYLCGA